MKKRHVLELVAVLLAVVGIFVVRSHRTAPAPAPPPALPAQMKQEASDASTAGPTASEIFYLVALDKKKAAETVKQVCDAWRSCLANDVSVKAAIGAAAKETGMPESNPEVLKAPAVRECLFKQAEAVYTASGCGPEAKRALLFSALDALITEMRK